MNINKVSQSIASQTPDFIGSEYPLFNKFIEYYYKSQEKTGLGQNILNQFLEYLDIDKLDISILDGQTKVVEALTTTSDTIVVENVNPFLEKNGSILIGDEVIYYENVTHSPNIALSPGISYEQVKLKWTRLSTLINSFDGTTTTFALTSQDSPIAAPTAQHLIVNLYGEVQVPNVDYTVEGSNITFTTAPRAKGTSDDTSNTYIDYLGGFIENNIVAIDNISNSFGEGKKQFPITRNAVAYEPVTDEYILAVYDNRLLVPRVDFFIDRDQFIFTDAPLNGRFLSLYSIEAPIPNFGSGAVGYSRVNDAGEIFDVTIQNNGSNYRYEYPPKVTINSDDDGSGASVLALVNGIKSVSLLDGGRGYSETNPPTVNIEAPTKPGSIAATIKAVVKNGAVDSLEVTNSGNGYTFTPRITFRQPGGAKLGAVTLNGGQLTGTIPVTNGGFGYTTVPTVYIDEPTGLNGIRAVLRANLTDGVVTSITIVNAGQGYETVPRVAVVDPVGAQVLETRVDGDGRVVGIDLLDGGSGYEDIPSVYVVDNRVNDQGVYIGGSGAKVVASIFNGKITDINITEFGSGYSAANPPTIVIQDPPEARASADVGLNEITGFKVDVAGSGYSKAKFEGCARAASGIVKYTEDGNAVFSNNTTAVAHTVDTSVKCLDALFVKRLLDKYTEQFLPDVPELDYKSIDVRTAIKTVKDFYSTKGTSFSIGYLFKLLYGETVSISYPKDQIIKPSAATWSVDTILRATLVTGDPDDIKDGLLTQDADIADPNIKQASALIENFISIKTSNVEIFELVLSEETIEGSFVVPYKTKLAEPLGTEDSIITVDSTIGWPERNGEFLIGGTELVQYKEKSLNQFIECTRSVNNVVEDWDSATEVTSNFTVFINKGTPQEVEMRIVGIVDAQQTELTDTGSYYLPGDKLTVSKLGGTGEDKQLKTWLYNVKKLVEVESITFGGVNNRSATVTCENNHGLLVGDQVTIYGANPIIYNGTFLVTSRDSETVFQYQLPQPAVTTPQGNILVSIDLNKGKSTNVPVNNVISPYTTNIQNTFFDDTHVYVASTGIPNYNIGPFPGSALLPGNQRKLNRFPKSAVTISTKDEIKSGPIGTWINGVSIWSYKSSLNKTFGAVTNIDILNAGKDYDAASPPNITISGGGGQGATADVTVDGSISEIEVTNGGSGYTSSPLVSIVGGGGSGAAATAIITKGVVSRILINDGGSGYTSQPSITIVGGGGTGATGTASVRGPIKDITITNGGSSYTAKPTVTLSSGTGAVAQAIVNNGRIISIAIISAGQGYTTAPEVTIQGVGFGAVARATIDTDGENAGRVTGITIVNKGIGYTQGTTVINLNSAGQDAVFDATVFKWNYNLQATTSVDTAKGAVFEGFNNQYGGEYAHLSNPQRLRYILGDNLFQNTSGDILEQEDQLTHSPIIGWAFDGNPIYGPYGYSDPTDQSSEISRLNTSYRLKTNLVYEETTNPYPVRTDGPTLATEPAGNFVEDYEYSFGLGDLDQYNGRFCKTPDFPDGRYCYFITIDATENGTPQFPYVLGPSYNSVVDSWNLNANAVQQNIPRGVVRYRDPYENVDIDVERAPNASTNALSLENGDIILFEVEDEDRSGVIDQAELDDPDQMFEESPLQLFDYFPSVRFDSKVDIEVETITKFEDATVTGFEIENAGKSYQVNDRLVFDNTDTDGTGVSARVSKIKGETISNYTFENIGGESRGLITTQNPHNISVGDQIFVDYTPVMDNTNKTFVVRQFKGIEDITISQNGSGYNSDIPPTITIDGDGERAELKPVVTSVGSIDTINIVNSGSGYTKNPRLILSHPQVFKKADYFVTSVENNNYVKINDVFVTESKVSYICGTTQDSTGNNVAFIAKLSATGVKQWEKTVESTDGVYYTEFQRIYVDGSDIWIAGINKPNSSLLASYNPDVILVKYEESDNGLDASIAFQKGYAGISGSTRSDNLTSLTKFSDTRFIIGGYTNTNSQSPYDAYIALVDTSGNFAIKRKIASSNKSEKLTSIVVNNGSIYFTLEVAASSTADDIDVAFGKATVGTNAITVEYIKTYTNTLYSFLDTSLVVDEFNEFYITATCRLKSDDETKDSFWIGKVDNTGAFLWNYRYLAPGRDISMVNKASIDIFGDLNVAFTRTNNTTDLKTVDTVKLTYKGVIKNHTTNLFDNKNVEGITAHTIGTDNSGDVYVYGQTSWNRNEFIFPFTTGASQTTDTTGHYTPTIIQTGDSVKFLGDTAIITGYQTATPSVWENGAIKFPSADLGTKLNDDWTLEFMLYKNGSEYNDFSQTQVTLFAIGDATDATGGLWMYYDLSTGNLECVITNNTTSINGTSSALQSSSTTMFADNSWQFIGLKKDGSTFTGYVNGIQVFTGTVSNVTSFTGKDIHIGNIPGRNGTAGEFRSNEQLQGTIDNLKLRNRAITPTVPSDVTSLPPTQTFALAFDWVDDAFFTSYLNQYDFIDYNGFGIKVDKDAESDRIGATSERTNTEFAFTRTAVTPVTGGALTLTTGDLTLAQAGFQSLDFDDATTTMSLGTETLTYAADTWSSRTATVPSPGSQKLIATATVRDRYFFKVTDTKKIDNIQELTINQPFKFTTGTKLKLATSSGTFINSGYIVRQDAANNKVYLAINNNSWTNDLNTGELSTEQFNEQSSYGIVGSIPNDVNEIPSFTFAEVNNTTPGTFDIDLADYDSPSGGTNNLDEVAKFKPYSDDDYSVRIDEVSGSSSFIVGSVVTINETDISYNSEYTTATITGLTGVLKITLVATLKKTLQVTAVANSDEVYVITATRHYLSEGENLYVDGNPSRTVSNVVYDEYDGSFIVDTVVSPIEFTYKLDQAAVSDPATTPGDVDIFIKSPVLKMYYGHQYLFDLSHSSLVGGNLSFSKDNLNKLEYSFNSIERIGTPGVTGEGQPTPTVKLKVDGDIVTNISYYFDPSRTGVTSPVNKDSYLDVVNSPYTGTFTVSAISGATITRGADTMKFPLVNEPEGVADITKASYSTASEKAVGSIADIRVINTGGFYTKLPVIDTIESTRKIERVQINEPGTEYAVGTYNGVPIAGDGEGGLVQITVADGTDDEGDTIPGQIQSVVVTSPGKGYTTASIDVEAINGILGPGLTGSGAELEVVIPPAGSGASVFAKGTSVGKIKKLKNNNFGYDYPHDYTLRPEITFPINAQLTSTSILDSITVTDPGSGYSQAPAVVITGGGGQGAIAESIIKNGRLDQILVKEPGSGYSSPPTVELKSSFNYVVNLDLGILQFAFPHGIQNGAEITLSVTDTGDGAEFPIASGAVGRLNGTTTYYAIAGTANSLEDDQLKIAITAANAELGDALTFSNAGTGRQQVLTTSFGGAATANVITSTFLEGELVYQGDSLENATAQGYVSTNSGWQVGPRILKIVDYTGTFSEGESVTGVISKSSGVISDLKIAKGVLEIGSITKTTGQFIDDIGKPSEIIQKIQDSYYYQDFSYAVKSAVSIGEWKDILIKNVHPASFKVFGELSLSDYGVVPNRETDFELTRSVELAQEAIVPNIQSFALVEPIYSEFNNTEVLFRQKRLTSSENILTSTVQRLDDISSLFDGVRTSFPLTVDNNNVVANENQLMIVLNGVAQNPGTSFEIQGDSIVFSEPPQPPASVQYVNVEIEQIQIKQLTFTNISGIFPNTGNVLIGVTSAARLTTTKVVGNDVFGFITEGTFISGEAVTVGATGFAANLNTITDVQNNGLFIFNESVKNLDGDVAKVERINLETGQETPVAKLRYTIGAATTSVDVIATTSTTNAPAVVPSGTFEVNEKYQFGSEIVLVTAIEEFNDYTEITVTRGQDGTTATAHQEGIPVYGTEIEITNALTLSKTSGTYQSEPGVFAIALNDYIIGASSDVVARITSTATYQDPVTNEFIGQVTISEGSSFFGLLFNRIASTTYPNVILDDISQSQVIIVDFDDNATAFDSKFPGSEIISNYVIPYDNEVGTFQNDEYVRNYKLNIGNKIGDFSGSEQAYVRKLTFTDRVGSGFFSNGHVIRTRDTKAEVIGYNQAKSTVYLGKIGRCKGNGDDYFDFTFNAGAQLNTYNKKFGTACLSLSKGRADHTFVSGVADAITAGGGATGTFTAATGTTYDPATGDLVLEIGAHTLTTSNTVTITDEGVVFTCDSDNNTNNYAYPRATDPASGSARAITAVTATTITVNVGAVPLDEYISTATSTELGLASGDFTIECWVKPISVAAGTKVIFDMRTAATEVSPYLYLDGANLKYYVNGSVVITGTDNLVANTWYHVAISRSGSTTKMFVDGTQDGSDYSDGSNYGTTKPLVIGGDYAGNNELPGYIDEFRVSTTARYTANFTAPTGIFQGDSNTKLLVHFDGTNGQTHTQDWSGSEGFTKGEYFNNDAILETSRVTGAPSGFAGGTHRYYNAADLIEKNKDFIAKEAVHALTVQYPSLTIPGGNVNCEDDIRDVLTALIEDLRNGSNSHIWDASALYVDRTANPITLNHVETEITETVWAYNKVDQILRYIINNVLWTVAGSHGITQRTDTTITDSSTSSFTTFTPTAATYDPATGDLVLTIGSHSLTTSSRIALERESITFTCADDNNERELAYPDKGNTTAYDQVLAVTAADATTITVNVGASPANQQYAHTFVSADTDAVKVLDYTIGDCADVYSTIGNLIDILTDTLEQANLGTPVDHLATITRVTPAIEFQGGTVNAFKQTPFTTTGYDSSNELVYTHRIDLADRGRFRDAADLIEANIAAIVDKASYDMLQKYPDLATEMPRNTDGSTDGTLRCKTDLTILVGEILKDVRNGGNEFTVQAVKQYLGANDIILHVREQLFQSVYAHERLGFYMKQAITGDLTYDNTDEIIVGDWDITNDPGNCANVQTAIDTLIDTANDILAPTNADFAIGADRLYLNRQYIAEEATGLTTAEFTYTLGSSTYSAFQYPGDNGETTCQRDLKKILLGIISDLQTGGNNSTIAAMQTYLDSNNQLNHIEDELLATVYAIERLRTLGEDALRNRLYTQGASVSGDQYAAQYTFVTAYRDSETPTDIDEVVFRLRDLVDIAVDILAPGRQEARSAGKNILYNENYYKQEIGAQVNAQFGSGSWTYDEFVEELVNNIVHDIVTTDTTDTTTARRINLTSISGSYVVGETVTSSGTGTATILEFNSASNFIVVGSTTGTEFADGDTMTGAGGATGTIAADGIGSTFERYDELANVKMLASARLTTSPVEGQTAGLNLFTNPEAYSTNWTTSQTTWVDNATLAPDSTNTADKITVDNTNSEHYFYRDYSLTAFETFDSGTVRFDTSNETFDTGATDDNENQLFTTSIFVKKKQFSRLRFALELDPASANNQFARFDVNTDDGSIGSLFNSNGITVVDHGIVPFGAGWFRVFITARFSFGFDTLRTKVNVLNNNNALTFGPGSVDVKVRAPQGGGSYDYFGWSIAVGQGKLVIGVPYDHFGGYQDNGSVWVFDDDGTNGFQLTPTNANDRNRNYNYYGYSVAVGSNKIVVGARQMPTTQTYQGAVFVYDLDGSNEVKIVASNANAYDRFGHSVAVGSNKVIVGAPYEDGPNNFSSQRDMGAVYIYDLDGSNETIVRASTGVAFDNFGWAVATAGGKIVVGMPNDDVGGNSTGSAFIYDMDGTNEVILAPSTRIASSQFGRSVAITSTKVLIGTWSATKVYLFDHDGSNEVVVTPSAAVTSSDRFGSSVALTSTKIIVGAPYAENDYRSNAGAVYTYDLDGTNETEFVAGDRWYSDLFGYSVAAKETEAYVGAPYDDDNGTNSGSAYILDLTGGPGLFAWGAKLSKTALDPYQAASGELFYSNDEFNIKNFAVDLLEEFMIDSLTGSLASPSATANFLEFYSSTAAADYNTQTISSAIRTNLDIIRQQLNNGTYYTGITTVNGITVPTKLYGERDIPVGISGGLVATDYIYGTSSDANAELESLTLNEGKIVQIYARFQIDGDITDGPFTMGETVEKSGDNTVTGVVYGFHEDENAKYLDVRITGGTWATADIIVGDENTTTATISGITYRMQIIDLAGEFVDNITFLGYTSGATASPTGFLKNDAAVTDNTGGKLTVDTDTLNGEFEKNSVVYPSTSRQYLDVSKYAGLEVEVGQRIASEGYIRLGISVTNNLNNFTEGNEIYKVTANVKDTSVYGRITEVDLDNNYIYVTMVQGSFENGDAIGDYGIAEIFPLGLATISTKVTTAGAASARIQEVRTVGINKRLYLSEVAGTFDDKDSIKGKNSYRAVVLDVQELKARVKRSSKGFDGTQTTFDLSIENGTSYLPDPAGHLMIFVNGILQPPGATNAYTAFSNQIQFTEAPETGATFTGFYLGKMRQLDDISFEFDSLRQSFNLKRNEVFYSLTLTDGVQSSVIRPENNIIVSLNGVLQEPGVGFEIVGSRIIFSEIPRVGSTFVAFSYVGSEADVDAAEVVPPIETGDFIDIQGETTDREVAVIESSNSLITFDYLGSVFGKDGAATANLTSGTLKKVQVTSGGSGYTSRPTVRIDSISGFDGNIRALIGVGGVELSSIGSGYKNPEINVETVVPDDWTAPNLADYGEEIVDPEVS